MNAKTEKLYNDVFYRYKFVVLVLLCIIFLVSFGFAAYLSKGSLLENASTVATHVLAIAIVTICIQILLARHDRLQREHEEQKTADAFSEIMAQISRSFPCLVGAGDDIFADTLPMIKRADRIIEVTVHAHTPRAPMYWFEALIGRLQESIHAEHEIEYHVKTLVDFNSVPAPFLDAVRLQVKKQEEIGVGHLVKMTFVNVPATDGCDIMVVDGQHVALRFCRDTQQKAAHFGLTFIDCPKLAEKVSRWYQALPMGVDFATFNEKFLQRGTEGELSA